ncbi:efflux RND transporter periplasmic adaptor subunit [Nocardioides albidus]|uniref:Efflux RND transporter periplasmic adaptor subunit n=1 Tax=Nocardioides albidus TaxID=1517589 RepID=A0A5C4VZ70_9ACTN|nr:efflux RND transporter periplasmic adaptor subunit [Nocardioides albidus]TNM41262.1 efflux RND transporter periplasmic adaptor subunit [Nocardioides albidus]
MKRKLLRRVRIRRSRRLVVSLVVLVVVAGATGGWLLLRDGEPAAAATMTATVTTRTLERTVTASGTVAAATTADLAFDVSGTVLDVYVEPGDRVKKGQRLAAIDDDVLRAELDAADSALDAAKAARSEHLADGASDEQTSADEAAVLAAESSLTQARDAVEDAVLRSTTAGTVTAVGIEVGDTVGSSSPSTSADGTDGTITVVSTGTYVVDATVASADVAQVTEGLKARLTVSGIAETVDATVSEVGLVAEADSSGAAVFPVTIAVTGRRDDLYAGTSAEVAIVVSQRTDVLTVDSRALHADGDTTYVDKVTDAATGATERVIVTTGETSGMVTEVLTGLAEGDVVEIPGFSPPGGSGGDRQLQDPGGRFEQGGGFPEGFTPPQGGFPGGAPR